MLRVYTIKEQQGKKSFWVRIGTCFTNKDGSLNVLLDALPTDGKLHIREESNDQQGAQGGQQPQGGSQGGNRGGGRGGYGNQQGGGRGNYGGNQPQGGNQGGFDYNNDVPY